MIRDLVSFRDNPSLTRYPSLMTFLEFLERRLGGIIGHRIEDFFAEEPPLALYSEIAQKLQKAGVITRIGISEQLPDEPRIAACIAHCATKDHAEVAGGVSLHLKDAFAAALAESLERYLWSESRDYFRRPLRTSVRGIRGPALLPEQFVGFTSQQREEASALSLTEDAEYLWIDGYSWTEQRTVRIPAHIVSRAHFAEGTRGENREPIIRHASTTGLATWPTQEGALLNGALEIIERDAFMIMWNNQLTLPRIDMATLAAFDPELRTLLSRCERYFLRPHTIRLLTDAPAYAVCVVVDDEGSIGPRRTVGLKAHANLAHAVKGALLEAIRARRNIRLREAQGETLSASKDPHEIVHRERLLYWAADNALKLDFLVRGEVSPSASSAWEHDTREEHLARIIAWCVGRDYTFASVPFSHALQNPTGWHVEFVIIPELQPMHQREQFPAIGGERLHTIPRLFGYTPREKPFRDAPHPFA